MRISTCGIVPALAVWLAVTGAVAQSSSHHHPFHEHFYESWQRPDVGGSCCNARSTTDGREEGDCEPTKAEIRSGKWFAWLQEQGNVADQEMFRVFNCGIGMIAVVAASQAEQATQLLRGAGETVYRIGQIRARRAGEAQTLIA